MTALRSPSGAVIQASGRLEERLTAQGWTVTTDPPSPGLHLVTAAEVDSWRATAMAQIGQILTTVAAIDVPGVVQAWLAAHPPPAGPQGNPGADGKSAYQLARDGGYGGTQTAWLASLVGAQGDQGNPGTPGTPGTTDYLQLSNRPTLATVATTGAYADLSGKPALNFDPAGSAATAQAAAVQRANHTGTQAAATITGLHAVATTGSYTDLTSKPTLGTAAAKDTGTGATQVVLGNDARLTDARTPTAHNQAASTITGLATVATTGAYSDLSGAPALPVTRAATVSTGALTANTVKNVPVTFSPALPNTTYRISALVESATPQNVAIGFVAGSKTTTGVTLAVRSVVAVSAPGLNIDVTAIS